MTVITPILKPVSQIELAPGSVVTIPNVSWTEFELRSVKLINVFISPKNII